MKKLLFLLAQAIEIPMGYDKCKGLCDQTGLQVLNNYNNVFFCESKINSQKGVQK